MTEPSALAAVIAALNAQRAALGNAAVDAAIAALGGEAAPATTTTTTTTTATATAVATTTATAAAAAAPPTAAAPVQRLRQVSILFVDVADSTRLLQQVGVEEAPAVVDEAVQRFAALVREGGGQVLRFTGDGLKAAFGAEAVREDEAEHAVRAGRAILEAAAAHAAHLRQQFGVADFAVRVGIHTGPVVLGGGAESDRSAIGHAVHLAARMEQSAPLGQLRISHDTWVQVRGLFEVQAQPPLTVKGHDEPLATYLVRGAVADAERAVQRGIEGLATPMIGRERELQCLLAAFEQAKASGRVRAITVLADAGVGKTRLRREFLARLGLGHEGRGLLQARAHPDIQLQPYGLVRQLLARWFSIADDLDAESARQRLMDGLAPWLGERGVARAQGVGQLIGMDFNASMPVRALSPRELRVQAFDTLGEALHRMAAARPLVVVLDDLHWADEASLDFVQHLARPAAAPLLLVMLARPALLERRAAALAGSEVGHETLQLAPLDAEQGPALAAALLQHLPDAPVALGQLLVQRAEGNPFYMEELVRMLIDDGVIDARRRPWTLQRRWQETARVPATLVGVLQARLDALPAHELSALQQASIVGSVFWDAALAALDAGSPQALPALQSRALVFERDHSAFFNVHELAFHHQMLHDVTYDTVLGPARREGHARAARWLAERVADRAGEFLGITAEHFERAGDSAQALEYYDRARADAERRYAHEAALAYVERALRQSALSSPMWHYQLLASRNNTLEAQGRVEEAGRSLADLAAYAEACDSDAMRADVLAVRMMAADRAGRAAEAEALARQAVELAERAAAPATAALAHGEVAWLALMRHDHDSTDRHIAQGIAWARRAAMLSYREGGYGGYEQQLRAIEIESLLRRERPFDASRAVADAMAALPEHKRRDRFNLQLRRARALADMGELLAAGEFTREAIGLARDIEIPRLQAEANTTLAHVAALSGDVAQQQRAAEEAETLARATETAACLALALDELAAVAFQQDRGDEARALWGEALALFVDQGVAASALSVRAQLTELDAAEGRHAEAAQAVRQLLIEAAGTPAEAAPPPGAVGVPEAAKSPPDTGPWPLATAATLVSCTGVLRAGPDAQPLATNLARELLRRLDALRAQAPDAAARGRLEALPHWRATLAFACEFGLRAAPIQAGAAAAGAAPPASR